MLRVLTSSSIHPDAQLANALMFCYPRERALVEKYLRARSAATQVVLIHHRDEWLGHDGYRTLLLRFFASVEEITLTASGPVLAHYEVLCVASSIRHQQITQTDTNRTCVPVCL